MGQVIALKNRGKRIHRERLMRLVLDVWFQYRSAAVLFDQTVDMALISRFCDQVIDAAIWLHFDPTDIEFLQWQLPKRRISRATLYNYARYFGLFTVQNFKAKEFMRMVHGH